MKRIEIYTDGTYFAKNPTWDNEDAPYKVEWLNRLLKKHPNSFTTVCEIGCGSGRVLQELSRILPGVVQYTGWDISTQAINLAQQYRAENIHFIHGDLLQSDTPKADLVVMFDVVEHVPDYYGFLEKLRLKGNNFAFHIPLDLCSRSLVKPHVLLQQRDAVGHIHYFSRDMVLWMLQDTGYEVIDWIYTKPLGDIKTQRSFRGIVKKQLRNLSFSVNKDRSADLWGNYSMMILAK